MSDVERPGQNPDQPPARNMADIARLFLDGARPQGGAAPKRIPPGARRESPAPAAPSVPSAPVDSATVRLALAATWGEEGWPALCGAAAGLAEDSQTTVALVGFCGKQFVIDVVGAESAGELPALRIDASCGSVDLQIARALFTLRSAVGGWLVAAPPAGATGFTTLAARLPQWLVVCPTDNDGLVAAYQQLKRAAAAPSAERTLGAFMVGDDIAQAATVHGRLRRAAREFLHADLPLAGTREKFSGAIRVAAFPVEDAGAVWAAVLDELSPSTEIEAEETESSSDNDDARTGAEQAVDRVAETATRIANVADAMFDHLAHVLDPEERAALGADFEPAPEPAPVRRPLAAPVAEAPRYDIRAQVQSAPPPAATPRRAPADMLKSGGTLVLRAFDLLEEETADRASQWQSIERSIRDFLPNAALLDARPPMAWASDSSLVIDAQGRLHVWTLFRDGASWFALREWATEHRAILALTRRDVPVKLDAEVAVHIVMPLDHPPGEALNRAGAQHVLWYRLRAVQWAGRRGAIVVPAH